VHVQLLLELIRQSQSVRSNIIIRLIQESQKVIEIKQETPYEARMREQREEEAREKNEPIDTAVETDGGIGKEKTDEEIAQERAKLTAQAMTHYATAQANEGALIGKVEQAIDEMLSQLPADKQGFVRELRAEVLMTTTKYRFRPALHSESAVTSQDKELQVLIK